MRYLYAVFILLVCSTFIQAQGPVGKLLVYTNINRTIPASLGYFQYPGGAFQVIDTAPINDMVIADGKLYASAVNDVYAFDTTHYLPVDTLHNVDAYKLAAWENKLVVC